MVTPTIHLRNYCTKLVYVKKYVIVFNGFNANSGLSSNQYYFYSCHYFYSCTTKKNLQTTPLSLSLSLSLGSTIPLPISVRQLSASPLCLFLCPFLYISSSTFLSSTMARAVISTALSGACSELHK